VRLHSRVVERPQGIHLAFPKNRTADQRIAVFVGWLRLEGSQPG
jgi:hypothetical protein